MDEIGGEMTTAGWAIFGIIGSIGVAVAAALLHAVYKIIGKHTTLESMLNANVQVLHTIQVYLSDNTKEHGELTQEFIKVQSEFRQLKGEFDKLNQRMDTFDEFRKRTESWWGKIEGWLRPDK